jgi:translation initiation factor 1 (eIF-1/SUI1)
LKKYNPNSPTPKIRLEKRSGKTVTLISGLHTYGAERLETIARELKSTLGAGGTVKGLRFALPPTRGLNHGRVLRKCFPGLTPGACAAVKNGIIEIQGDKVTPIKIWFERSKV